MTSNNWSKIKARIIDVLLDAVLVPHVKWDNKSGRENTDKGIKGWYMEWRLNCVMQRLKAQAEQLGHYRADSPQDRLVSEFTTVFTPNQMSFKLWSCSSRWWVWQGWNFQMTFLNLCYAKGYTRRLKWLWDFKIYLKKSISAHVNSHSKDSAFGEPHGCTANGIVSSWR